MLVTYTKSWSHVCDWKNVIQKKSFRFEMKIHYKYMYSKIAYQTGEFLYSCHIQGVSPKILFLPCPIYNNQGPLKELIMNEPHTSHSHSNQIIHCSDVVHSHTLSHHTQTGKQIKLYIRTKISFH